MNTFNVRRIRSEDLTQYFNEWLETHNDLLELGFSWASLLEDNQWNQYISLDVISVSPEMIEELQFDTICFTRLIQKTYKLIMTHSYYFSKLGLPKDLWLCAEKDLLHLFSYFCRYDVIHTNEGNKFIDIHSDFTTGYMESSIVNDYICRLHKVASPNHIAHYIQKAWFKILEDYDISKKETIFFTSLNSPIEAKQTVIFNKKNCPHLFKEYIAFEDIIITDDGVYTLDGRSINVLYRFDSIEKLLNSFGPNCKKNGMLLLEHVRNRKIKLINPLSAFITQTKTLFVVIWEILKNEPHLYSDEEQAAIRQYLPYTSFEKEDFEGRKHVVKHFSHIKGIIENANSVEPYEQKKIYQEYIEMPEVTIGTWDGLYTGNLLIGTFAIGGEPAGLFLRITEKNTGKRTKFVGVTKNRQ